MLSPYRVLDLTNEEGLLCAQILADLGADVIAVEPPGGSFARRLGPFVDGVREPDSSLYWWAYARNKRSLTVDLETDAGRAQIARSGPAIGQDNDYVLRELLGMNDEENIELTLSGALE
jgi:crotonobetainyl-CoA:carnitine CoA-transferase CaiB-like acyl-CoA transferase